MTPPKCFLTLLTHGILNARCDRVVRFPDKEASTFIIDRLVAVPGTACAR